MARSTQLMDLPDELLLEIVARVPYNAPIWPSFVLVNCRFNELMATRSLPTKAAVYQYNALYRLIPPERLFGNPIRECSYWSTVTPDGRLLDAPRHCNGLLRTGNALVLAVGLQMEDLNNLPVRGAPQLYALRLFRMLPINAHSLLHYTVLQYYKHSEYSSPDDALFMYCQDPQRQPETQEALRGICAFLEFENNEWVFPAITHNCSAGSPLHSLDLLDSHLTWFITEILHGKRLPIEQTGRFLPCAMTFLKASSWLDDRPCPFAAMQNLAFQPPPNASQNITGDARTEAVRQLNIMRDLCQRIEAENGQYANQLLRLDLEAIRAIIAREAQAVRRMCKDQVQESLREEIRFLVGSI